MTAALVSVLAFAALFPAIDAEKVQEALDRAYSEGGIQRDLTPDHAPPPPPKGWSRSSPDFDIPAANPALGKSIAALLWTVVAVVAVLLVLWIASEWAPFWPGGSRRSRRKKAEADSAKVAFVPQPEAVRIPDHARLAGEGKYGEAIHALLVGAWSDLARRSGSEYPPALTSREILRRTKVGQTALEALGRLVRAVESTIFGGREAREGDYRLCLEDYRRVGEVEATA